MCGNNDTHLFFLDLFFLGRPKIDFYFFRILCSLTGARFFETNLVDCGFSLFIYATFLVVCEAKTNLAVEASLPVAADAEHSNVVGADLRESSCACAELQGNVALFEEGV